MYIYIKFFMTSVTDNGLMNNGILIVLCFAT